MKAAGGCDRLQTDTANSPAVPGEGRTSFVEELRLSSVLDPSVASVAHTSKEPLPLRRGLEIRTASPEETAAAWALQRTAFDLPPTGPSQHPGDTDELRVVVDQGRVVSCLTLLHARLIVHGTELSMAGARHVATDPDLQNCGHGSALMRDTLQYAWRQGITASVLFPFSFRYYRKFGYELGGNHCHFWCRPNSLPAFQERVLCRRATEADAPRLESFFREATRSFACSLARPAERWKVLCQDPALRVTVWENRSLAGVAVTEETRDSYGGRVVRVLDMAAAHREAWRGLVGHLSQFQGESMEWLASTTALAASGLLRTPAPLREGFKPRGIATVRPMFQFRIVDLAGALRCRLSTLPNLGSRFRLGIQVRDEIIPENGQPITVAGTAHGAELRPTRPTDPIISADIQVMSQIFCGYLSPDDAVSQGLATVTTPAALEAARILFPDGEPFLAELDRF